MRFIPRLDEVMISNVDHDFSPGEDFDMKLIFDLLKLLDKMLALRHAIARNEAYPSTMSYVHGGSRCCLCCNAQGQDEGRKPNRVVATAEIKPLLYVDDAEARSDNAHLVLPCCFGCEGVLPGPQTAGAEVEKFHEHRGPTGHEGQPRLRVLGNRIAMDK